jgi:RimJ/RimL family protein N-acetyltransferase
LASSVTDAAAVEAVDVILRDGGTLRLRPPAPADAEAVLAFFTGLSPDTMWLRFHGTRRVDNRLTERILEPDWINRGALVGWLDGNVVALASYERYDGKDSADVAFVVADKEQRRGIGTRLLGQLAVRARDAGIAEFVADVMAGNAHAARVFADTGFELVRELEGGEIELRFPIAATGELAIRVESRDHVGVVASLRPFFAPKSVAVIGASRRRGTIGGELFRNILEADFNGVAYPVNRNAEPVAGVRAYSTIDELPDVVDLAVICLPGGQVLETAEAALRNGVRALCVISAGFAETVTPAAPGRTVCSRSSVRTVRGCSGPTVSGSRCLRSASTLPLPRAPSPTVASAFRRRAGRSVSRYSRRRPNAHSASPRLRRSETRPTSRPTTCSNGGRTTTVPTSCCCTSSRSATRAPSLKLHAASRAANRSWRSRRV